jgi:broad specificity phosphatase PhoE
MRQIYTSPRQDNIDRIVALLADNDVETTVTNRSNWNRPTYQRFSYSQRNDNRDAWPQVWVKRPDDFPKARALLKDIGIEPAVRFQEELRVHRHPRFQPPAQRTAARIRLMVLAIVAGVRLMIVLKATQVL